MTTRTTTKKTAAKAPVSRTRKAAVPAPEEQEVPLVTFEPREPAPEGEPKRVLVFELGGKKHYALAEPPAGIFLAYLKRVEETGDLAYLYLIRAMCGEEAYDALAADPTITLLDVGKVAGHLRRLLMGRAEDPKA